MAQIPNISHPIAAGNGTVTTPWYQYLMALASSSVPGGGAAPANADYVVGLANPSLPNARVATDSDTVTVDIATPGVIRWHAVGSESWVPLALGVEPLTFVSDGAGSPILVGYTPDV